jgi:hypothetical protein
VAASMMAESFDTGKSSQAQPTDSGKPHRPLARSADHPNPFTRARQSRHDDSPCAVAAKLEPIRPRSLARRLGTFSFTWRIRHASAIPVRSPPRHLRIDKHCRRYGG